MVFPVCVFFGSRDDVGQVVYGVFGFCKFVAMVNGGGDAWVYFIVVTRFWRSVFFLFYIAGGVFG